MPDGVTLHQSQPFHRCQAGGFATTWFVFAPERLDGDGIRGAHGGSGMSSLGGTLRMGELLPGKTIRHALKINLNNRKYFAYNNDGTRGYRWPAIQADSDAATSYGGRVPALEMGALLALKPDFNIDALKTEPARIMARALRDYGAYAVDSTGWDVIGFATERGPDGRMLDEFKATWGYDFNVQDRNHPFAQDIATIAENLYVIDNNRPNSIGGGGTPRTPLAPPFAGEQ
jgi:hypothetical protein